MAGKLSPLNCGLLQQYLPPPVQRPIPIWFGGSSDAVVRRAARLGDG
jgi:alkanesulfonate monooxygenase SsuD/methylene tetrahydromethanopterin reductase-like flavin-dependent oxidoreductase (luciferase family)